MEICICWINIDFETSRSDPFGIRLSKLLYRHTHSLSRWMGLITIELEREKSYWNCLSYVRRHLQRWKLSAIIQHLSFYSPLWRKKVEKFMISIFRRNWYTRMICSMTNNNFFVSFSWWNSWVFFIWMLSTPFHIKKAYLREKWEFNWIDDACVA